MKLTPWSRFKAKTYCTLKLAGFKVFWLNTLLILFSPDFLPINYVGQHPLCVGQREEPVQPHVDPPKYVDLKVEKSCSLKC